MLHERIGPPSTTAARRRTTAVLVGGGIRKRATWTATNSVKYLTPTYRAAIPEALAGMPCATPVNIREPSSAIRQPMTLPVPGFRENRNRLFSLSARSVGDEPDPVLALTPCAFKI